MTANEDDEIREALSAARDRLVMRWPSEPTDRKHIACLDRLIAELRSRASIGPDSERIRELEWTVAIMRDGDAFEIVGSVCRTEEAAQDELKDWRDTDPGEPLTIAWRRVGEWEVAL